MEEKGSNMAWLEDVVNAHAAPCVQKVQEGNAPFLVLAVGMAFKNKTIDIVCLTE